MRQETLESKPTPSEAAPSILVNSTLALFPVIAGSFIQNILTSGEIKAPSFILFAFAVQNLFLCFFWRRLQSQRVKLFVLLITVSFQWGYVATILASHYLQWPQGTVLANYIAIFFVTFAIILYAVRMGVERSGSAAAFALIGVLTMAGFIWRGLNDWIMTTHVLNSHQAELKRDESSGAKSHAEHLVVATPSKGGGTVSETNELHWSYQGETGPDIWGSLKEEFRTCSQGINQSPVDIPKRANKINSDFKIEWVPELGKIVNNGHTIQVNLSGKSQLIYQGLTYKLKQFHFHTPSEHQLSGLSFPMEVHFVHSTADGRLAVLGVFVEIGNDHPELAKIFPFVPSLPNSNPIDLSSVNMLSFIPKNLNLFRYQGSLTTPPCTEGVMWNVFAESIEFSRDQVVAFRRLFPVNSRPVQPMGRRNFEGQNAATAH